jgi:hypothetical protein
MAPMVAAPTLVEVDGSFAPALNYAEGAARILAAARKQPTQAVVVAVAPSRTSPTTRSRTQAAVPAFAPTPSDADAVASLIARGSSRTLPLEMRTTTAISPISGMIRDALLDADDDLRSDGNPDRAGHEVSFRENPWVQPLLGDRSVSRQVFHAVVVEPRCI